MVAQVKTSVYGQKVPAKNSKGVMIRYKLYDLLLKLFVSQFLQPNTNITSDRAVQLKFISN